MTTVKVGRATARLGEGDGAGIQWHYRTCVLSCLSTLNEDLDWKRIHASGKRIRGDKGAEEGEGEGGRGRSEEEGARLRDCPFTSAGPQASCSPSRRGRRRP